jgi:isopropylmalate/homocitrate/citramalate synthase
VRRITIFDTTLRDGEQSPGIALQPQQKAEIARSLEELGLTTTLPLGKHSGRHAFAPACADAGLQRDPAQVDAAFTRFKALADSGDRVSPADVFEEVAA